MRLSGSVIPDTCVAGAQFLFYRGVFQLVQSDWFLLVSCFGTPFAWSWILSLTLWDTSLVGKMYRRGMCMVPGPVASLACLPKCSPPLFFLL